MRFPKNVSEWLTAGQIGVIPTDTIYGLATPALNKKAVERVYKLRRRNPKKPFIILVSDIRQVIRVKGGFGIALSAAYRTLLTELWPGSVSVVLPCAQKKYAYLHRGTKTLAFRYPKPKWLNELIKKTGPLVSTSANWEGKPPAQTIKEAKRYFGETVDFYVDIGKQRSKSSTLIKLSRGKMIVLRRGAVRVRAQRKL